ncbi:MAG: hypothetical protein IT450_16455 [Phycisphaerales bacterium]|nr:hypothetical protein [Phycisphaerales bacterium]
MPTVESILEQADQLPEPERERLLRALRRRRFDEILRRIERKPAPALPVSEEELDRLVHEARREVLRARGL